MIRQLVLRTALAALLVGWGAVQAAGQTAAAAPEAHPQPTVATSDSQQPPATATPDARGQAKDQDTESFDFAGEMARLRSGDPKVDFTKLRFAYAATKDFSPYDLSDTDLRKKATAALKAKKYAEALDIANQMLAHNYLNPTAHIFALRAEEGLEHTPEVHFHQAVLGGLFDSICTPEEGTTKSKPWKVIAVYEEYFVIGAIGLNVQEQSLIKCGNGNPCDQMSVADPDSGKEFDLYFDVSIPFARMSE